MFHTGDPGLRALEQRNLQARAAALAAVTHGLRQGFGAMMRWIARRNASGPKKKPAP